VEDMLRRFRVGRELVRLYQDKIDNRTPRKRRATRPKDTAQTAVLTTYVEISADRYAAESDLQYRNAHREVEVRR